MQTLSRLLGLLPLWLHPLTWPSMERRTICQAMGDPSGLPQGWKKRRWSSQSFPCLSNPKAALATPVPADRQSWAAGPVAGLKLNPASHVGYQGQLRSRPGCSGCTLPGCQEGSWSWSSSTRPLSLVQESQPHLSPTLEAGPAPSSLELSRCRGQGRCTKPQLHGPEAQPKSSHSLSKQHLASLDLSPRGSLAPPRPALIRSSLGGRVST